MLGKTANGIYWMFRYLERAENVARLIEAGQRIAMTRSGEVGNEWRSVIATAGATTAFEARFDDYSSANVANFLLRDRANAGSVLAMMEAARSNGRLVRTAITREVWEAINECFMALRDMMARSLRETDMPAILGAIKQQSALVRGALHGTMLRNDVYNFARIGTFIERADNSARILDVKYYVLLPSSAYVGSKLDNVQWDNILRSLSAQRSYRWLHPGDTAAPDIARFLILDRRFPRSLIFCCNKIAENLDWLAADYGDVHDCQHSAAALFQRVQSTSVDEIFEQGLHEYLQEFLAMSRSLALQVEHDYRFHDM